MPAPSKQRWVDGPEQDVLDLHEVAAYLRISASTLKRLVREGQFPRPMEMTPGSGVKAWKWSDCVLWVLLSEARPRMKPVRTKKPAKEKS